MNQFFPHANKNLPMEIQIILYEDFKTADKKMLIISFLSFLGTALITSYSNDTYFLGVVGGGIALFISIVAYLFYKGTLISRLLFGIIFMIYPSIMLQQQLGMIEMHFAFFYMVSFLMMYKDISSILAGAFVVTTHHVLFTYLQLNNVEVMGEPLLIFGSNCSWTITLIHMVMWTFALVIYMYIIIRNTQRFIKIRTDNTQLSNQAKKLDDLNLTLEQKVVTRTEELEESNDELQAILENLKQTQEQLIESEKMASLGTLVAGVAHEINTPVGIGFTGSSHFLFITEEIEKKHKLDNMTEEDFEEYIQASKDLATLINSNLDRTANIITNFKQVAVDQTSEQKRVFNVLEYIHGILISIDNTTKKKDINIDISCKKDVNINSYPGLFAQIITNLVINSVMHGFKNKDNGNISIDIKIEDNSLKLLYKDDGKGISKENLLKIYEPFFTTNREAGGTGLGLNIIYNIVTVNLKGSIDCKSKEGDGSAFTIIFPLN